MMLLHNPYRGTGLPPHTDIASGTVHADAADPNALLRACPAAAVTPLHDATALATELGVASLLLKDEGARMGLGSFKALGAAYVIAGDAVAARNGSTDALADALHGRVYACASAGNHGLSVAAGARLFGAHAIIYLASTVPEDFADRLRARGAEVVRAGDDYAASMQQADADAHHHGWTLLSDSSWPGYVDLPARVMQGYLVAGDEVIQALAEPPTHLFLQAGVGGFAAAMAAIARARWGDQPRIVVVEPDAAPALLESIRAGSPVMTTGPDSNMGRLDCKSPSHLALSALAEHADDFVTISDSQADATVALLNTHGFATTPSGAAGVAALHHANASMRRALDLTEVSRPLAFLTERISSSQ